jgi:hypothetical protein
MTRNINTFDRITRFVTGFAIIAAVLTMDQIPAWFTLLAIFPVFTAIIRWDPLYTLSMIIKGRFTSSPIYTNRTHNASA